MSTFGIPYAAANDDGSVTCPICGARIVSERKDFESFSGRAYADHYAALHESPSCGGCGHGGHWRECQADVVGLLGSTYRCECRHRGPSGDYAEAVDA